VAKRIATTGARPLARRAGAWIRALLIRANLADAAAVDAFGARVAAREVGKALLARSLEVAAAGRATLRIAQRAPERAPRVSGHEHACLVEALQARGGAVRARDAQAALRVRRSRLTGAERVAASRRTRARLRSPALLIPTNRVAS